MPLPLLGFLFVTACAFSVPVMVLVLLAGDRLGRNIARSLIAASFGIATGYMLWRMEWFDVWRHGVPGLGYVLSAYVPYISLYAGIGWVLGSGMTRRVVARAR